MKIGDRVRILVPLLDMEQSLMTRDGYVYTKPDLAGTIRKEGKYLVCKFDDSEGWCIMDNMPSSDYEIISDKEQQS